METLARIIDLSLERLNNAEYANHMTRFLALIPVKQEDRPEIESVDLTGPAALGFTDEQINTFKNELNILTDVVNKSLISDETVLLAETDKQRDELVVYFTSTVRQMTKSPVSAQRNAAISLYNQVKIYVGIQKLADTAGRRSFVLPRRRSNTMDKSREELEKEYAEATAKLEQYQHRGQRYENRIRYYTQGERKKRNHRLITRGGAVESIAPEVRGMSERAFFLLMEKVFSLPEVAALVSQATDQQESG